MDSDHLDIYGDSDQLHQSFNEFVGLLDENGVLIINEEIADKVSFNKKITYGLIAGDAKVISRAISDGLSKVKIDYRGSIIDLQIPMPGAHNLKNAIAATVAALQLGISGSDIKEAFASFKGIKRRFEFIIRSGGIVFIDDYAHHPEELKSVISSARELYPNKKILVIFQPHLYTRTRDFMEGFRESLNLSDEVILLDIYPARELPIKGISSQVLSEGIKNCTVCSKAEVTGRIENTEFDVIMTLGAGDIDTCVQPLKEILISKFSGDEVEG
jgi:UDP-N-acetylmuramate--alanine ligase